MQEGLECVLPALAGSPSAPKTAGSLPREGAYLGCGFDPQSGHGWERLIDVSLLQHVCLSPQTLSLHLKSGNVSLGMDFLKNKKKKKKSSPWLACLFAETICVREVGT